VQQRETTTDESSAGEWKGDTFSYEDSVFSKWECDLLGPLPEGAF
jgi:hypothetical protein